MQQRGFLYEVSASSDISVGVIDQLAQCVLQKWLRSGTINQMQKLSVLARSIEIDEKRVIFFGQNA